MAGSNSDAYPANAVCDAFLSVTSSRGSLANGNTRAALLSIGTNRSDSPCRNRIGIDCEKNGAVNMQDGAAHGMAAAMRVSRNRGWKVASRVVSPPNDNPEAPILA